MGLGYTCMLLRSSPITRDCDHMNGLIGLRVPLPVPAFILALSAHDALHHLADGLHLVALLRGVVGAELAVDVHHAA